MDALFLGIDTSCYTTSVACIRDESIVLDERMVLSVPLGARGLRQSEALFQHNRNLPALLARLYAAVDPKRIAAVGVSAAPTGREGSYMPVFLAGRLAAQAIAGALCVPCIETTHQKGHVLAALHGGNEALLKKERFLALHLSGGTTDVLRVQTEGEGIAAIEPIGCSKDLHAGQVVDRLGVSMGLPFPAGKHLELLAQKAESRRIRLPSSVRGTECSLSGVESAAQRLLEEGARPEEVAFGVYDCLARTIAKLVAHAAETTDCRDVLLSGGVASSLLLRDLLLKRCAPDLRLHYGLPALSSDNAVGVAIAAKEGAGWKRF